MSEFNLARIPLDSGDLSPAGVLVMIAEELGYSLEHGFKPGQYILRSKAEGYPEHSGPGPEGLLPYGETKSGIKSLYCSARIRNNRITLTGACEKRFHTNLFEPDCFDKLQKVLADDLFWITTSKDMDTPIVSQAGI